jgi:hypothetical protein
MIAPETVKEEMSQAGFTIDRNIANLLLRTYRTHSTTSMAVALATNGVS